MSFTNQVDLSVLLQNTQKPSVDFVDRSSTKAVDVSKLEVCFGGFNPVALSDGTATREQIEEAERRVKERRESLERAAAIEAARMSDERTWADAAGTLWTYVLLDGEEARIMHCEPASTDLSVPETLEEKPVVSLASDACSYHDDIESVTVPDSVMAIGYGAFRFCRNLKCAVLPKNLPTFDPNWFRGCKKLERLQLPGMLGKIDARLFDLEALKLVRIGAGTVEVEPGAFRKSALSSIEVDEQNPLLSTDGMALYAKDRSIMVALAVPVEEYRIAEGCRIVAKKAFSGFSSFSHAILPDTLEVMGDFALANTAITSFHAPSALKAIGEKAFYQCGKLREIELNEGLVEVRNDAFSSTAIEELRLPASVERLGNPLAAGTGLTYVGPEASFSIASGSEHLKLDAEGCLYRNTENGYVLDRMMNPNVAEYVVAPGTVSIGEGAFAAHLSLRKIVLPDGLRVVGKRAFKGCRSLEEVRIPDSLQTIGDEAFLDTQLSGFAIPSGLELIGGNALVTYGAHHGTHPSLHSLDVNPDNERFYLVDDMLLERRPNGTARLLLCLGNTTEIDIPQEVTELAPYAFNGVAGIEQLHVSERVASVGMRALGFDCLIPRMIIDLAEPVDGHAQITLDFPGTDRSAQQQMLALSVPDHVDASIIMGHYDTAIINASGFDALNGQRLPLYDQATRIVDRLKDPLFLSDVNRGMCQRALASNIEDICVEAAKHDDKRLLDDLLTMGYLNNENINQVIDRVGAVQDASITGYLLEAKRERFGLEALDFDL